MSHLKRIEQARTPRDFVGWAVRKGATTRQNGTSHVIVTTPKGFAIVCQHPGEIPKEIRSKIIKAFVALGLAMLALSFVERVIL